MADTKLVAVTAARKPPRAGMGRPKGSANKTTTAIKDAVLQAANAAHPGGMVGYLTAVAQEDPKTFIPLLGRVLPLQINGEINQTHGVTDTLAALLSDIAGTGKRITDR